MLKCTFFCKIIQFTDKKKCLQFLQKALSMKLLMKFLYSKQTMGKKVKFKSKCV